MPRGNLAIIRVRDGKILDSNISTVKRANTLIKKDLLDSHHGESDYVIVKTQSLSTYRLDGSTLLRNDEIAKCLPEITHGEE